MSLQGFYERPVSTGAWQRYEAGNQELLRLDARFEANLEQWLETHANEFVVLQDEFSVFGFDADVLESKVDPSRPFLICRIER